MPRPLPCDEVHLWRTSTRLSEFEAREHTRLLCEHERAKAARFRRDVDRVRYIAAHAALRLVLSRYTGARPEALELETDAHGKPRLAAKQTPTPTFSLSHSGDLALIAVGSDMPVGVDVEQIREDLDVAALAASVLSSAEQRVLERAPAGQRRPLFFKSWVRKETVLKASGIGLGVGPDRVVVLHDDTAGDGVTLSVQVAGMRWRLLDLDVGAGYAGSVAARDRGWSLRSFDLQYPETTRFPATPGRGRPY